MLFFPAHRSTQSAHPVLGALSGHSTDELSGGQRLFRWGWAQMWRAGTAPACSAPCAAQSSPPKPCACCTSMLPGGTLGAAIPPQHPLQAHCLPRRAVLLQVCACDQSCSTTVDSCCGRQMSRAQGSVGKSSVHRLGDFNPWHTAMQSQICSRPSSMWCDRWLSEITAS